MSYLSKALKDGYANIIDYDGKRKITYITSDNHTENYEDPEEKVRAEFWAELIYKYDYPENRIKIEVTIPDRLPTDRADIVVFRDDDCKRPYAVIECKKDGVADFYLTCVPFGFRINYHVKKFNQQHRFDVFVDNCEVIY